MGAEQAVKHYADACLEAGVAMVNCVPVFIASDPNYAECFRERGLPIIGDDIKSQCDNMKMCAFSTGNSSTIAPSCGRPSPMIREHGRLNTQEVTMCFRPVQVKSDEERFPTDTLYCKTAESEEVQDRLKPEHLKIRNQNSGRSTLQWTLLCFLAKTGGELS